MAALLNIAGLIVGAMLTLNLTVILLLVCIHVAERKGA